MSVGRPFSALLAARSPETWTLSSLFAGGALGSLLGAVSPFSPAAPVRLSYACSVAAGVVALVLWLAGDRLGRRPRAAAVTLGVGIISLIIANVATTEGATITAFAYLWVAIYAAHFFPRPEALAQAALISVGFAAALLVNDLPGARKSYVVVVGTIWAAVVVLSNLVARLREQAGTDQLTGLLNRAGFRSAALREHALAVRTGTPLVLAVLDLDGFKSINDRDGHAAGDAALHLLATRWRAALRTCDVLARHGGDEFVLLLPATDEEGAEAVLERLRGGSPLPWSAGVAVWGEDESLDDCFARADRALYEAKVGRAAAPSLSR